MTNTYDIGDVVRVKATLVDVDGNPVDPGSVVTKYEDPSGTVTAVNTPSKESTGVYYTDISVDESGMWHWKCVGTGANAVAEEGRFLVREQQVP